MLNNIVCWYDALGRHLVLWYSSQVVAATERGDVFCERVAVEGDAAVPHHDAVLGCTHDDDLQLHRYK